MSHCARRSAAPLLLALPFMLAGVLVLRAAPARALTVDWVPVADPANPADDTGFGSVASHYRIARSEVTNAEYAAFLNAVAVADANALYNPSMGSGSGGITRSGSAGSYSYTTIAGRESRPVNFVSFYDSLRFANWLHNGQPVGMQDAASTEDGAYTITAGGIAGNSIARNAGATIFLASEDEWYKAAYYDAVSMSYFDHPAGSDGPTGCAAPGATPNTANCGGVVGDVTVVGSYTGSASPSGTFDQGGNVREWTEGSMLASRIARGGGFGAPAATLSAASRLEFLPDVEALDLGFRVASLPEPGTGWLLAGGLLLSLRAGRRGCRRGSARLR